MSKENYESKLALLQEIPADQVKRPNMPISNVLQEAEDLYIWALEDKEALENNSGLDWLVHVEDIPVRAGALRHVQSLWNSERYSLEEATKKWKETAPKAYQLRDNLLDDFRYAFRKQKNLINRVRAIAEGRSHADMIQDLSDLSVLGKSNAQELIAAKFDLRKLNIAAQQSEAMAKLLAQSVGASQERSETKQIRDRAYAHLKEAIDEVRDAGKYVFRHNPERYKGYINRYHKK